MAILYPGVKLNDQGLLEYGYKLDEFGVLEGNTQDIVQLTVNELGIVTVADSGGTDFNTGAYTFAVDGCAVAETAFGTDSYVATGAFALYRHIKASRGAKLVLADSTSVVDGGTLAVTPGYGTGGGKPLVGASDTVGGVVDFGTIAGVVGGLTISAFDVRRENPTCNVSLFIKESEGVLDAYTIQLTEDATGEQFILNAHVPLFDVAEFFNFHFTNIDDVLGDDGLRLRAKLEKEADAEVPAPVVFTAQVVPWKPA